MHVQIRSVLIATAIAAGVGSFVLIRREPPRHVDDYGIPSCPTSAANDLLSTEALQCWFTATHGRWRTLSHQSAYGALVVQVEAFDPADAEEITRRFVDGDREKLSEVSVYVQGESPGSATLIRRIRWTPDRGLETLEFSAPAAR